MITSQALNILLITVVLISACLGESDDVLQFIKEHNITMPKSWFKFIQSDIDMCLSEAHYKCVTHIFVVIKDCLHGKHIYETLWSKDSKKMFEDANKSILKFGRLQIGEKDILKMCKEDMGWYIRVPAIFGINIVFDLLQLRYPDELVVYLEGRFGREMIYSINENELVQPIYTNMHQLFILHTHCHYYRMHTNTAVFQIIDKNLIYAHKHYMYNGFLKCNSVGWLNNDIWHKYKWLVHVHHHQHIVAVLKGMFLPSNTSHYIYDGPETLSPKLYDTAITLGSNITLVGSSFIIHVLLWSKHSKLISSEVGVNTDLMPSKVDVFLSYYGKDIKLPVPEVTEYVKEMYITRNTLRRENNRNPFQLYHFKALDKKYIKTTVTIHNLSVPRYDDCYCGGLFLYSVNGQNLSIIQQICGRYPFLIHSETKLPENVSFVSSGSSLLLIFVLYNYYANELAIHIRIETTECRGVYPMEFITKYIRDCRCCFDTEYSSILRSNQCIYVYSLVPIQIYRACLLRSKLFRGLGLTFILGDAEEKERGLFAEILTTFSSDKVSEKADPIVAQYSKLTAIQGNSKYSYIRFYGKKSLRIGDFHENIFHLPQPDQHIFIAMIKAQLCKIPCTALISKDMHLSNTVPGTHFCDVCAKMHVPVNLNAITRKVFKDKVESGTCIRIRPVSANRTLEYAIAYAWTGSIPYIGDTMEVMQVYNTETLIWKWINPKGNFEMHGQGTSPEVAVSVLHASKGDKIQVWLDTWNRKQEVPNVNCGSKCEELHSEVLVWHWQGFRYSVHRSKEHLSWSDAEKRCMSTGGHLVSIHGTDEVDQLCKMLLQIIYKDERLVTVYQHLYYIGLMLKVGRSVVVVEISIL